MPSPHPEELEETHALALPHLEVVSPRTLARWRQWAIPEEIISKQITQRQRILRIKQLEEWVSIPNFAYKMPRLPEIEAHAWGFAKAIDFEGHIAVRVRGGKDKIEKVDKWRYRYEYVRPRIVIGTKDSEPSEEMANMMHVFLIVAHFYDTLTKRYVNVYRADSWGARAVRICHLIEPYLKIPEKIKRAQMILQTYKQSPQIVITR